MTEDTNTNTEREDIPDVRNDGTSEGGRGDDPTGPTTDSGPQRDAPRAEPIDTDSVSNPRSGPETVTTTETTTETRSESADAEAGEA